LLYFEIYNANFIEKSKLSTLLQVSKCDNPDYV